MKTKIFGVLVGSIIFGNEAMGGFGDVRPAIEINGDVVTASASSNESGSVLDYKNARPAQRIRELPGQAVINNNWGLIMSAGEPEYVPGSNGDMTGFPDSIRLVLSESLSKSSDSQEGIEGKFVSHEYGVDDGLPFTTSRVDILDMSNTPPALVLQLSRYAYYARAGKLFLKSGEDTIVCSGSLIKPGLVLTAAHCVMDFGKGKSGVHSSFQFVPAYFNGEAPFGVWGYNSVSIGRNYYSGTSKCQGDGVTCEDDVALIELLPDQSGHYPGDYLGWFGIGINGYGFNTNGHAQITALGYPVSHDKGVLMQRTDSIGVIREDWLNNTVIGTRQTGGASGGPWLVNFGQTATLSNGVAPGGDAASNVIIGVSSWGTSGDDEKIEGASPLTSDNLLPLLEAYCPQGSNKSLCQ